MHHARRITLVASAVALVAATLGAQPMQFYAPSNTPTIGVPKSDPWGSNAVMRHQVIIDKRYLPSTPGRVVELSYAPSTSGTFTAPGFEIRMAHTTLSNFRGNTMFNNNIRKCGLVVKRGTSWTGTANQWSPVGLDRPFGYDGQSNILIQVCYSGKTGGFPCYRDMVIPRLWQVANTGSGCQLTSGFTDTASLEAGVKMRLTIDPTYALYCPDTVSIAGALPINGAGAPVNNQYKVAASFGQSQLLKILNCNLSLAPDNLFSASLNAGPPIFNKYNGTVQAGGVFQASANVPNLQVAIGLCVYHAAVVFNGTGITGCTNTCSTEIVP